MNEKPKYNKLKNKSIELGFNGKINEQFYKKWKSTNKVRIKLIFELFLCVFGIAIIYILIQQNENSYIYSIGLIFITCFLAIMLFIMRIFIVVISIKKERFKEYYDKNK